MTSIHTIKESTAQSSLELEGLPTIWPSQSYRSRQDLTSKALCHTSNVTLKMATNLRKGQRKLSKLAKKDKAAQAAQKTSSATSAAALISSIRSGTTSKKPTVAATSSALTTLSGYLPLLSLQHQQAQPLKPWKSWPRIYISWPFLRFRGRQKFLCVVDPNAGATNH